MLLEVEFWKIWSLGKIWEKIKNFENFEDSEASDASGGRILEDLRFWEDLGKNKKFRKFRGFWSFWCFWRPNYWKFWGSGTLDVIPSLWNHQISGFLELFFWWNSNIFMLADPLWTKKLLKNWEKMLKCLQKSFIAFQWFICFFRSPSGLLYTWIRYFFLEVLEI